MPSPSLERQVIDLPVYWFAVLEKAVEQGHHETAAKAHRELLRLGVRVAYGRPRAGKESLPCK